MRVRDRLVVCERKIVIHKDRDLDMIYIFQFKRDFLS